MDTLEENKSKNVENESLREKCENVTKQRSDLADAVNEAEASL